MQQSDIGLIGFLLKCQVKEIYPSLNLILINQENNKCQVSLLMEFKSQITEIQD